MAPELVCEVETKNKPNNAAYIELLVLKQDLKGKQFTENPINLEKYGFDKSSEIVEYNQDGYISYIFHCNGAIGEDSLDDVQGEVSYCFFGADENTTCTNETKKILRNLHSVQFAYVDLFGKVLCVTDPVKINTTFPLKGRDPIHIEGKKVDIDFSSGPLPWPLLLSLFCGVGILLLFIMDKKATHVRYKR